jgi:transcriptional regulator with XRE-family HTH domain
LRKSVLGWLDKADDTEEGEGEAEDETSAFGDWLYNERQARQWTREELAEKAEITGQAIYQIETGRVRNPWKQTRERLVRALGVTESSPAEVLNELEQEEEIAGGGQLNDFSPWDDKTIPEAPCVYVYYDRTDRPIYIGQTSSLRRRNVQHQENEKWFFRRLVERGAYIELKAKADRDRTEKLLIHFLGRNTMFNKQHARE